MLESFGIHFLDSMHIKKDNHQLEGLQTKIEVVNTKKIPENTWINSKHKFIAEGGETVMMIGNFNKDEDTKVIALGKKKRKRSEGKITRTYHLFDHFVLSPVESIVECDLIKQQAKIYADNIRHSYPKLKKTDLDKNP